MEMEGQVMSDFPGILTGAGSGIGLSIANLLLSDPHVALVVAVDLITAPLVPVRSQHDDRIELIQGDVSERSTSEAAINTALSKLGRIDAIILNAAVLGPISSIADGDVVEWKRSFDVNFFSLLHTIQLALPHLRKSKGRIIMTSSGVSLRPCPSWVAYACAKSAMNYLCSGLMVEDPSVACICVTPGIVETGLQKELREQHKDSMDKAQYDWLVDLHKDGQLLHPDKPAASFAKLAVNAIPEEVIGKVVPWDDPRL